MKYIKNLTKTLLYTIIFFIISSLILTIFNYFNIINYQILNIGKIIIPILSIGFSGLLMGKKFRVFYQSKARQVFGYTREKS